MKKIITFVLIVILLFSATACAQNTQKNGSITLTDMKERTVTLAAPAEKIVVLTAGDCEILFALGVEDRIIGRGEYCNYPSEVTDIAMLSSGRETNVEQIIALNPQLVIMSEMDQSIEQMEALESAGIAVLVNDANNIEETYTAIMNIGIVTAKTDEAQQLINEMKETFENIKQNTIVNSKTVYFEVSPISYGLWTAGSGTYMNEIAQMAGVENIFGDVDGWVQISEEQVIERNPDYIVTITMFYGDGPTPIEEIKSRYAWQNINAVKNDNILNIDPDAISRPGPRLMDAANEFYNFINEISE